MDATQRPPHGEPSHKRRHLTQPLSARHHTKCFLQYESGEAIFITNLRYSSPAAGHAHTDA